MVLYLGIKELHNDKCRTNGREITLQQTAAEGMDRQGIKEGRHRAITRVKANQPDLCGLITADPALLEGPVIFDVQQILVYIEKHSRNNL
jgi:hypothetical protein